tara:strand:+ start:345 stop:578 length:234 start_codon:yes stop_codon:yes gene_type:complete
MTCRRLFLRQAEHIKHVIKPFAPFQRPDSGLDGAAGENSAVASLVYEFDPLIIGVKAGKRGKRGQYTIYNLIYSILD